MSELRRDPVSGRWVVIAPERSIRPRDFAPQPAGAIDGDFCPFCEGQESVAGRELLAWRNPGSAANGPGWLLRVVPNREPVLHVETDAGAVGESPFQSLGGLGAHEVIIESPDHRATLATMGSEAVARVLSAWRERMRDLRHDIRLRSFLVVKNFGALAGATLDHPHSQLVALPVVPQHLEQELQGARMYYGYAGRCVFCDMVDRELEADRRLVSADEHVVSFTPFASRVPFEAWVIGREHRAAFEEASDETLAAVAERLGDLMRRLDRVLVSPPYTLLLHSVPTGEPAADSYHWHLELLPRFQPVNGLAWDGALHVNPVPPEEAAEALRTARL